MTGRRTGKGAEKEPRKRNETGRLRDRGPGREIADDGIGPPSRALVRGQERRREVIVVARQMQRRGRDDIRDRGRVLLQGLAAVVVLKMIESEEGKTRAEKGKNGEKKVGKDERSGKKTRKSGKIRSVMCRETILQTC
jgi:hypothetical protein